MENQPSSPLRIVNYFWSDSSSESEDEAGATSWGTIQDHPSRWDSFDFEQEMRQSNESNPVDGESANDERSYATIPTSSCNFPNLPSPPREVQKSQLANPTKELVHARITGVKTGSVKEQEMRQSNESNPVDGQSANDERSYATIPTSSCSFPNLTSPPREVQKSQLANPTKDLVHARITGVETGSVKESNPVDGQSANDERSYATITPTSSCSFPNLPSPPREVQKSQLAKPTDDEHSTNPSEPDHHPTLPTNEDENMDGENVSDDEESLTKDRKPYSLSNSEMFPSTRTLLGDVCRYFTKPVNLQRATSAVSETTIKKVRERLHCYLGFLYSVRGIPLSDLDERVFRSGELLECYIEYLAERRQLNPSTVANHICSLLYVLKFIYSSKAPQYHGIPLIAQLRRTATVLQKQGDDCRASTSEDLERLGKWMDWDEILQCLEVQRNQYDTAVPQRKPRLLMDLVLLCLYCQLPPSRCLEIRSLRIWRESLKPFELNSIQGKNWNVILVSQSGEMSLHFNNYKTRKFKGHDVTRIENDSELAVLLKEYLQKYRQKLVSISDAEDENGYLFLNSHAQEFSGPAFTKHLKSIFYKLSGKEISVNVLRSSFVTYVYSQRKCTDSLKDSLAAALRHSRKQAQLTYDKRTTFQRKQEACDFARLCAEDSIATQEQAEPSPCPFSAGDFVAIVEKDSTLKEPKVLIGQIQHFKPNQEVSLLWYKHHEALNSYSLELDGEPWLENVNALHSVKMAPLLKGKPGHYRLSTAKRSLHKAVFCKK